MARAKTKTCTAHCRACGGHFTSNRAFDKHRSGGRCVIPVLEVDGGVVPWFSIVHGGECRISGSVPGIGVDVYQEAGGRPTWPEPQDGCLMAVTANGGTAKRYVVSREEWWGKADLFRSKNLDTALRYRDEKRLEDGRPHTKVLFRVTDAEDPERGEADWCSGCGARGAFGADPYCEICEQEDED